jgi:hypothetical protein
MGDEDKAVGWSHHRRLCFVSILLFHSPTPASVSFAQKLRQLGDGHGNPSRHIIIIWVHNFQQVIAAQHSSNFNSGCLKI